MATRPSPACIVTLLIALAVGRALGPRIAACRAESQHVASQHAPPRDSASPASAAGAFFGPPATDPPSAAVINAPGLAPRSDRLYVVGRHFPLEGVPVSYEIAFPTSTQRLPMVDGAADRVMQAGYEEIPLPPPVPSYPGSSSSPASDRPDWTEDPWGTICTDHLHFYSVRNLTLVGVGIGVAAVLANSSVDENISSDYQDYIHSGHSGLSAAVHQTKFMGNGWIVAPVCATAMTLGVVFDEDPVMGILGDWGQRTTRSLLVGAPPVLILQYATGAGRPGEHPYGSDWRPLTDANGVSGHAFMGAVPLMVAAKMTDNPYLKAGLYGASLLTGWSRVDDDAHYTSQVVLGWWLAYAAATAIDMTEADRDTVNVVPLPLPDSMGLGIELRR